MTSSITRGITIDSQGQPAGKRRVRKLLVGMRRNGTATFGAVVVAAMLVMALFAQFISPYDPVQVDMKNRLAPPSLEHWFGTDQNGRDSLSRIIWGARISIEVGIVAVGIASIIGVPLGVLAGYKGGFIDDVIMRVMDAMFAFPTIILAIAIVAVLGPSFLNVVIAVGVVYIPTFARTARAPAMSETQRDYVSAARAMGAKDLRIVAFHVAPNCMATIIVRTTISLAYAILAEAGLSFLGLGVPPPEPAWGRMLNEARGFLEIDPWLAIFPGLFIALIVLGFNLLGDGLRDALDPRLRGTERV